MKGHSLVAAALVGSTVLGSLVGVPLVQAQEIESSVPGNTYEDIPEIEPAPDYGDSAGPEESGPFETFGGEEAEIDESESTSFEDPAPSAAVNSIDLRDTRSFNKSEKKVAKAIETFEEFLSDPDIQIPSNLLRESEGIIILPDVVQAGFFFGGRRGTGVMSLRNEDGSWSNPAFVKITGGSLGLQIGAKSSDLVLIFPRRSMVHEAFTGSYKLGGSVSGTAGSLGRNPVDSTREYSDDTIYAYSRSSGFYGGISLEGSELSFNRSRNKQFYGQDLTPRQIFAESYSTVPPVAESLSNLLTVAESGRFRLF